MSPADDPHAYALYYYTRAGDKRIFWRWFSLDSGVVGSQEMIAYGSSAPGINGLAAAGGVLYATTTANKFYAVPHGSNGTLNWADRALVDDGSNDRGAMLDTAAVRGRATALLPGHEKATTDGN